jgi:DNA-binding NtrC family response regulator
MSKKAASPVHGLHVLISQLLRDVLIELECSIVGPVRSVDEAVQAIRTNDVDCAQLDVHLGGTSSARAANELALRRIPFIVTTGQRDLGGYPPLLRNAPLLTKPFKVQDLHDLMSHSFGPQHRRVRADAAAAAEQGPG